MQMSIPNKKEHQGKGRATPARLAGPGTRPETGYREWLRVLFWSRQGAGGGGGGGE